MLALRARQSMESNDWATALALYAESNARVPTDLARANALFLRSRIVRMESMWSFSEKTVDLAFLDGRRLVGGFADGGGEIRDVETGELVSAWKAESGDGFTWLSPDASLAVHRRKDHSFVVRKTADGSVASVIDTGGREFRHLEFAGGMLFASIRDAGVWAWKLPGGEPAGPVVTTDKENPILDWCPSSDGRVLYLWMHYGQLHDWTLATRQARHLHGNRFISPSRMFSSPDGDSVYILTGTGVSVWDVAGKKMSNVEASHRDEVEQLAFVPGTKMWISMDRSGLGRFWQAGSSKPTGQSLQTDLRMGDLAVSPDGRRVAAVKWAAESVSCWRLPESRDGEPLKPGAEPKQAWFVRGGLDLLLRGADHRLRVIDLSTREKRGEALAIPADAKISVSRDEKSALAVSKTEVKLLDLEKGGRVGLDVVPPDPGSTVFVGGGRWILSRAIGKPSRLHDCATGRSTELPFRATGTDSADVPGPEPRILVQAGDAYRLFDPVRGEFAPGAVRLTGHFASPSVSDSGRWAVVTDLSAHKAAIIRLSDLAVTEVETGKYDWLEFQPGTELLVQGLWDFPVWDCSRGGPVPLPDQSGLENDVRLVAFNPDLSRAVFNVAENWFQVWDPVDRKAIGTVFFHGRLPHRTDFSPDGRYFLEAERNSVGVRDLRTGESAWKRITIPVNSDVEEFLAGGRFFYTACRGIGTFLWDTETGQAVGTVLPHPDMQWTSRIVALAHGPTRRLVTFPVTDSTQHFGTRVPRVWDLSFLEEEIDPGDLNLAARVLTGLSVDERGDVDTLDEWSWPRLRREAAKKGLLPK
jgi:WD40 repeat protein